MSDDWYELPRDYGPNAFAPYYGDIEKRERAKELKCYRTFEAWRGDDGTMDYSDYIQYYWAESAIQAKLMLLRECVMDGGYFNCRAVRVPELDGEPLTTEELYERGYYSDEY